MEPLHHEETTAPDPIVLQPSPGFPSCPGVEQRFASSLTSASQWNVPFDILRLPGIISKGAGGSWKAPTLPSGI